MVQFVYSFIALYASCVYGMTCGCVMLLWTCSAFRNKTTSKLRPLTMVPRVVIFVRFYCISRPGVLQQKYSAD